MEEYYNDFQDTQNAIQDQDGEQQFQYDFPTQPVDEVDDGHNNLFSVDHYTDAATYDESIAIAAAFADPAQPPQSLALLQQQTEEKQAAKKKIVGYVYKKAPNAPKRWRSSYIHFFTDFVKKRKRLQKMPPRKDVDGACDKTKDDNKLDMHALAKEASKAWKELPANEKEHWDSISKKEKEEYEKQLREFEGPLEVRTDKVKKKDLGAPKRSPPAFFLFTKVKGQQLKELNPSTPHAQIVKECGKFWRNMSDLEKAPYREEEQKLRAQYYADMEKWKEVKKKEEKEAQEKFEEERKKLVPLLESDQPESAEAGAATLAALPRESENVLNPQYKYMVQPVLGYSGKMEKPRTRKRKNHKGTRADDDTPKRPPSAFFLFVNNTRHRMKLEHPDLPYQDMISRLSRNWKAMTDEQRKPYRDREVELREQYYFKMRHYKKIKKDNIRLKGGFDEQQQSQNGNVAEGVRADVPLTHTIQAPEVDTTTEQLQQVQQQPLTFAPLTNDVVQEAIGNYRQEINYHEDNHDYQHDLSYADYDPINVTTTKNDESGEYNEHHQASIDYSAVGDYFGL